MSAAGDERDVPTSPGVARPAKALLEGWRKVAMVWAIVFGVLAVLAAAWLTGHLTDLLFELAMGVLALVGVTGQGANVGEHLAKAAPALVEAVVRGMRRAP